MLLKLQKIISDPIDYITIHIPTIELLLVRNRSIDRELVNIVTHFHQFRHDYIISTGKNRPPMNTDVRHFI